MPIREIAPGNPGEAGPDLRLRVSAQAGGGFDLKARSPTGERVAIEEYEFFVRDASGAFQTLPETDDRPRRRSFAGTTGTSYTFAARAVDDRGVRGPLAVKSAVAR